jgi:hypothetical protein
MDCEAICVNPCNLWLYSIFISIKGHKTEYPNFKVLKFVV